MPTGTPVVVNGLTLGLSGSTGDSTGPHLHIGKFSNGQAVNPGTEGFNLDAGAYVWDTGSDASDGNFVRVYSAGYIYCYLHLSQINVTSNQPVVGQPGRGAVEQETVMNEYESKNRWRTTLFREPENDQVWRPWVGHRVQDWDDQVRASQEWLTNNHILKVAYPAAKKALAETQAALENAKNRPPQIVVDQAAVIVSKCNDELANVGQPDPPDWLTKLLAGWLDKVKS
jgi:hypothetical protein